jgi:hypothetical protein
MQLGCDSYGLYADAVSIGMLFFPLRILQLRFGSKMQDDAGCLSLRQTAFFVRKKIRIGDIYDGVIASCHASPFSEMMHGSQRSKKSIPKYQISCG